MDTNNQNIKLILGVILIAVLTTSMFMNMKKNEKKEESKEETKEEVKFTKSETIVWNLYVTAIKTANNLVDEDNLDTLELVSIEDYGRYLKNKPDLRYKQINFRFTCKDKSNTCVKVGSYNEEKDYYGKMVTIDLSDQTFIDIGGIAFLYSDEFITPVDETFTYYGLEE